MMPRCLAFGLTLCAALSVSSPSSAQDAGAKDLYAQGQKAFGAGEHARALPLFEKALASSGSPNARLYVARCLRELGRLPEAHDAMSVTVREATALAARDRKYEPTRDAAAAELALLEPRVARLTVAVADPPPGAQVTLDGAVLVAARLGAPFAVAPGKHSVVATAPGKEPLHREITVNAGEAGTLALAFAASSEAPGAAGAVPTPQEDVRAASSRAPDEQARGGGLRTVGFVTAGVGLAGVGVFAVAGSIARGKLSTLETECGGVRCTDPKYGDVVDSGETLVTVANVGLVVGIVGVTAGAALIVFGGPSSPATVAVAPSPGVTAVRLSGRF